MASMMLASFANAQDLDNCPQLKRMPGEQEFSQSVRERLITLCIEEQKKEYEELIKRTETIAKLSEEIEKSYTENNKLLPEDEKKLKEVEDLIDKIRKELRADDDDKDDDEEKPADVLQAIQKLKENTTQLLDEIKKTTRHSISAAAIQTSSAVKKLLKFIRIGK